MRIGFNPQKDKEQQQSDFFHQVVIPVYIPNKEGYFRDSFTILKLCLNSLFKTCHNKTYFTVVNNGSCDEVRGYLDELFQQNKINEVIHTTNIGYINAMLKGITGQQFPFITNTDADVLFLDNWQEATYAVFDNFPKTGAVSPVPNSKMLKFLTGNIFFDKVFSKRIGFSKVKNPQAMIEFARSINNKNLFNDVNLEKYLTINKNNFNALIGAGHFVVTYRSDVFDVLEKRFTKFILGGDSDFIFDYPVVKRGFWRLSTADNYAYHMGNMFEDWMLKKVEGLKKNDFVYDIPPQLTKIKSYAFVNWFKINFFSRILFRKSIWRLFLRYKGLTKVEAKNY
nr:glycosyltransferase family A protein [uncultured Flavobacterium sp.]